MERGRGKEVMRRDKKRKKKRKFPKLNTLITKGKMVLFMGMLFFGYPNYFFSDSRIIFFL